MTEQQEFVAWLKKHGLYNEFDSAHVMRRMQSVWEQCRVTQQQLGIVAREVVADAQQAMDDLTFDQETTIAHTEGVMHGVKVLWHRLTGDEL